MSAQGASSLLKIGQKALVLPSQAALSTSSATCRDVQTRPKREGVNVATLKKGTGYRSSFSGTVATVFGATGMVGRGVVSRLGKNGSQVIIPYRGDYYAAQRLKVAGDLGQILFSPYDLKDEESVRTAMKYSDVVINLIGREFETLNYKFHDVNVVGPANMARIAREMGVKRFIHISSINASENPPKLFLPGGSKWLKTKWLGERAVLEQFPEATIFRPCEMYGFADYFVNYYNAWFRKAMNSSRIALWKKGLETVRAPLFVGDLTSGIMAALNDPSTKGKIFEAMGPNKYLQADLVDWMHEVMHKDPVTYQYKRLDLMFSPVTIAKAIACSYLPVGNIYFAAPTLERLERSQLSEVSEGLPGLQDLGIKLHTVEEKMMWELDAFRAFRYHKYQEENKPVIHPLVPLTKVDEKQVLSYAATNKNLLKVIGL